MWGDLEAMGFAELVKLGLFVVEAELFRDFVRLVEKNYQVPSEDVEALEAFAGSFGVKDVFVNHKGCPSSRVLVSPTASTIEMNRFSQKSIKSS
ncbi:hypothetical protein AYI70_g10304 [Smittium culicis]|uniref:Uncharacterized protein n=1 Tax=Smittium culicis TaxID=133412 RepID=A0A1R1X755_9FUNG|nr:hypothetical protein AYI70_g10304 [Smittium culicis]